VVSTCSSCCESLDFICICLPDCGLTRGLYLSGRLRYWTSQRGFSSVLNKRCALFQVPICTSHFVCSPPFFFFNSSELRPLLEGPPNFFLQILQFTVSHKIKIPRHLSEATTSPQLSEGWTGKCGAPFTPPSQKSDCHINLAFPL
jgi:hypothetical protein